MDTKFKDDRFYFDCAFFEISLGWKSLFGLSLLITALTALSYFWDHAK